MCVLSESRLLKNGSVPSTLSPLMLVELRSHQAPGDGKSQYFRHRYRGVHRAEGMCPPRAYAPPSPSRTLSRWHSKFPSMACMNIFPRLCSLRWDHALAQGLGLRDGQEVVVQGLWMEFAPGHPYIVTWVSLRWEIAADTGWRAGSRVVWKCEEVENSQWEPDLLSLWKYICQGRTTEYLFFKVCFQKLFYF